MTEHRDQYIGGVIGGHPRWRRIPAAALARRGRMAEPGYDPATAEPCPVIEHPRARTWEPVRWRLSSA
ncbi:MAG: hypothetical protein ABS81_07420 [Pseudonocardia sp. SCN 72-86]|nr:MAG: hypothetical protein ABS81_07420 [Pseudonocardia sp. SCN 72-86]